MKCPKCHNKNRDRAKFCNVCGTKLDLLCHSCGNANLSGSRFCDECGQVINSVSKFVSNELSLNEKLKKIQRYLPKGLTEKILSKRDKIEGERKLVTVMFCDMEGFTPLVEKIGPEKTYIIMDSVYELLIRQVHDFEGTVNEMTGDGIMALFGAPVALEDAPQRAIQSAMAIHREMNSFSDKVSVKNETLPPLKMRIGIHTGQVVVGTLGNDLRVEFKAVGDTVNLASRMEGLAKPGTTYVTEDTFKLTEGFFRFESLGVKKVKGKNQPVKVYRVLAPSTLRTRFDVSAERGLTPFVARERELELLLDGYDRTKAGRGRAFSVVAEAGMGKSRLLYEFRKAVVNEDITFLEGKCLSYSRGTAFHPITDILKVGLNIQPIDQGLEIRNKIISGLRRLGMDEKPVLPYLLEILSVEDTGINRRSLSPEAQKAMIMESLQRIVLKTAVIRPLIMVIEDLHWVDKSSENVLNRVLDCIPRANILLIVTYRPEYTPNWNGRSYHSQLTLNRLSDRENRLVASYLLDAEVLDQDLEELILEKAEGVPFFIEEFIKSLKDLKFIERKNNQCRLVEDIHNITVPSTIQDVIMARVDRLPQGAKDVLQMGAVVEREFSLEVLKRAMELNEKELLLWISALKKAELVYEYGLFPEITFIFNHALTRDVIYSSILAANRKKLHLKVGNAIQALYKKNIMEYYGILAEHYIAGETFIKGAEYSKLAAERSERAGDIADAIDYTRKRVASLEKLSRPDELQKEIIDARTDLGRYLLRILKYKEAKDSINPIIELTMQCSYKKRLPEILTIIGTYQMNIKEDAGKAFESLEEAVKVSRELKDDRSMSLSIWRLGLTRALNCEFEKASQYFENALTIMQSLNIPWEISAINSYLSIWGYGFSGKLDRVEQTSKKAMRIAEENGDIYSKSMAYTSRGFYLYQKGFPEEAKEYLLKALHFCETIDFVVFNAMARIFLAELYYDIGEYQNSEKHHAGALSALKKYEVYKSWTTFHQLGVARSMVMNKANTLDLNKLYCYVNDNKVILFDGWKQRYLGEILFHLGDQYISEAEKWIRKAINSDGKCGMILDLARDYKILAGLLREKGDKHQAKENLNKAINIFQKFGADGWVERTKRERASCLSK